MLISALIVRAILVELERTGCDVGSLRRDLDLPAPHALPLAAALPVHHVQRLLLGALKETRNADLGLWLGSRTPHYALHALSGLLRSAPSLADACRALIHYAPLLAGPLSLHLREEGPLVRLTCNLTCESRELRRFGATYTLCLARTLLGQATGGSLPVVELSFVHEASGMTPELACRVSFGRESDGLAFARALLSERNPGADPELHAVFTRALDESLIELPRLQSFRAGVLQALRYEQNLAHVDFARIASRWGITRRVLRARLRREGQTFAGLLNEARLRSAQRDLSRADASVKEIADRFGYAETSSFQRAFKRWCGVPPGEYRRLLRERQATERERAGGALPVSQRAEGDS